MACEKMGKEIGSAVEQANMHFILYRIKSQSNRERSCRHNAPQQLRILYISRWDSEETITEFKGNGLPFQTKRHRYRSEQLQQFAEECRASPVTSTMQQHHPQSTPHQLLTAEAFAGRFLKHHNTQIEPDSFSFIDKAMKSLLNAT